MRAKRCAGAATAPAIYEQNRRIDKMSATQELVDRLNDGEQYVDAVDEAAAMLLWYEENTAVLLASLKEMVENGSSVNTAFYGIGTRKALEAAMDGQKEILGRARKAIAASGAK